ncbi:MAG: hypothetical protein CMJ89_10070 [Planctomycetes bacterium]|nr:hypothetical protein [Planctomycetota bacterium]
MRWTFSPVALLVLPLLPVPSAAQSAAPSSPVRWKASATGIQRAEHPDPARALGELVAFGETRRVLLRFERPLTEHSKRVWREAGVEIESFLGSNAYFARVDGKKIDRSTLKGLGGLADAAEIELDWKLHPTLVAGETPAWTRVPVDGASEIHCAVYITLHPSADLIRDGEAVVEGFGGRTVDFLESINGLVCEMPRSQIGALALSDGVQWVEPALPKLDSNSLNDSNRIVTQANQAQAAPYGLDGSGVTVLVYDAGFARASHQDFSGRLTARDSSGQISHATHVSATVGGDGSASGGQFMGMAPGVTIESYGFEDNGFSIFLYHNPGDFESDYDDAMNLHGADIANNSIGSNIESNGFPCVAQGDYGIMASLIDAVVRGSLGAPFRIVWASGNERQGTRCNVEGFGSYYSMAPPAGAKNHIGVGALNSNDDSVASFSSWGPTDDGRLKPDVSAPGCEVGGDGGVTSAGAGSDSQYVVFCGTSMASPTVCGLSALLLEDYRVQFPALADPRNSTLKILLAHSANDGGNIGPDFEYGYGSVRIVDAIELMRTGNFLEDSLADQGAIARYVVDVGVSDPELKLTLAWDDVPGTPNVRDALVNDLDLVVRDPSGVRHYPWTLDPLAPSNPSVRSQEDHLNNVEQVEVSSPTSGMWVVEVRGTSLPGGTQPFSLVSSHVLTDGPYVRIGFPLGLPTVLTPGSQTGITADIVAQNDTLQGTPVLFFRYDGGAFLSTMMVAVGSDRWTAFLPPPVCNATPEFYVGASGTISGTNTSPSTAPGDVHQAIVHTTQTVFADDFETDTGWTVFNEPSLIDGGWERGTPAGEGDRGDPFTDYDGSGQCFLTDNIAGNSDVDGTTRLLSPSFDLSASGDYYVSYARWFTNDDFDTDVMDVEVRDGGGAWVNIETTGNDGPWSLQTLRVNDFIPPSAAIQFRFSAADDPNDSVTEAGVDGFRIERRTCPVLDDCNGNGILDSDDIASGRSNDADMNGIPDECSPPTPPTKFGQPGQTPTNGGTIQAPH